MSADHSLSMLIHANSKVGKSTLAATAPDPQLILDAEGGTKFLQGSPHLEALRGRPFRTIIWTNSAEPPPEHDGTWDACVLRVADWDDVRNAYRWLTQHPHSFRSLVVDSITEIQRRCKANLRGTEAMAIQDWGQLLSLMDAVIRGFRDLTIDPHNPIQVAVFIAEMRRDDTGRHVPYLQGQIAVALPYWLDIVGVLYIDNEVDANGQATRQVRKLLVSPHPQYEAGERVQGRVGPVISEPNIERILAAVYPDLNNQNQQPTQEVTP